MSDRCEFCDLPRDQCLHALRERKTVRAAQLPMLEISPSKTAHFPGCWHKGDDPDKSTWGEVRIDPMGAWQRLGNKTPIYADAGNRVGAVATRRCQHCEDQGSW